MRWRRDAKYTHFLNVRLDEELATFIEVLSKELGVSKSAAVRLLLKLASRIDPEEIAKKWGKDILKV